MYKIILVSLLLLATQNFETNAGKAVQEQLVDTTSNETNFRTAAYLPEYRLDISRAHQICEHLTDLILFSAEPSENGDLAMLNRFPQDYLNTLLAAREKYKTKVLLCIGGGGRSSAFSSMASSAAARRKFSLKVLEICRKWALDGIDLDWEGGLEKDPAQWKNLESLILEIKSVFEKQSPSLQLSLAIHIGQEDSLTPNILKSLDRIHLMAYDACSKVPCQHSTLGEAEAAVIPAGKLVLGIPAYGRMMQSPGQAETYADLFFKYGPLSKEQDIAGGFYFNGRATVVEKARMAKAYGLAGVFVWEAGQDLPPNSKASLLASLAKERRRMARRRKQGRDAGRKALHRSVGKSRTAGHEQKYPESAGVGNADASAAHLSEL